MHPTGLTVMETASRAAMETGQIHAVGQIAAEKTPSGIRLHKRAFQTDLTYVAKTQFGTLFLRLALALMNAPQI